MSTEQEQKGAIIQALRECGHVGRAAECLCIDRRRLYRLMKRHGLTLKVVLAWPFTPRSFTPARLKDVFAEPTPAPTDTETPKAGRLDEYTGRNLVRQRRYF